MSNQFSPDQDEPIDAEVKLRRWREGIAIAIEQSQRGQSKPLDLESVLARVEARLSHRPQ